MIIISKPSPVSHNVHWTFAPFGSHYATTGVEEFATPAEAVARAEVLRTMLPANGVFVNISTSTPYERAAAAAAAATENQAREHAAARAARAAQAIQPEFARLVAERGLTGPGKIGSRRKLRATLEKAWLAANL